MAVDMAVDMAMAAIQVTDMAATQAVGVVDIQAMDMEAIRALGAYRMAIHGLLLLHLQLRKQKTNSAFYGERGAQPLSLYLF